MQFCRSPRVVFWSNLEFFWEVLEEFADSLKESSDVFASPFRLSQVVSVGSHQL